MAEYTTSQETMAQGAAKVEEASGQIKGLIGSLDQEVQTMMGGWRGDAAGAFIQVHSAFEEQANKINSALQRMYEALQSTHQTYGTQESDQTSSLSGLAGQING